MSLERRRRALGMLVAGMRIKDVAHRFGVNSSTISRLRSRNQATGEVRDRQRTGRPRKTTLRQDRYLVLTSRRNPFMSAPKLASRYYNMFRTRLSSQTVRNTLRAALLRGRKPYVGVPLTAVHRCYRYNWAAAHQRWRRQQWNNILFIDESRFTLQFSDDMFGYGVVMENDLMPLTLSNVIDSVGAVLWYGEGFPRMLGLTW